MNNSYKPLIVALFLGMAGLVSGALYSPKPNAVEVRGILGGPSAPPGASPLLIGVAQGAQTIDSAALTQNAGAIMSNITDQGGQNAVDGFEDPIYTNGAIQDPGQPIGPIYDPSETITYTVKKGDNLSSIAVRFGVPASTIIASNPSIHKKMLQIGQKLQIVSAVAAASASDNAPKLPNFNANFVMPAQGYNWGVLHNNNAVDVANSCGTPVVASAEGLIVPDPNIPDVLGAWNGGYGNFVFIEHPFGSGIYTRYAHLQQILVQVGDYVKQGQQIGLMGDSGESTGCHVHFEVIGAQNPFVK